MNLLHNRLRRIKVKVRHLGTEVSFNLNLSGLETVHEPLGAFVSILLQPAEVIADSTPDFGLPADKPGGHALRGFGTVDVSADLDLDLHRKRTRKPLVFIET